MRRRKHQGATTSVLNVVCEFRPARVSLDSLARVVWGSLLKIVVKLSLLI